MSKPEFKKGTPVYYHPIITEDERYLGFCESEPWPLGCGQLVVHLFEMEPSYQKKYGKNRVVAASVDALELFPV